MIATKDQERKAIEEIRKIVDNLGENSYVGAAMTAAERMAEAVECGENARPDAIRYRAMTEEVKEWKDIIKLLDNIVRKQAGR